jgi:hypothetical protein
MKSGRELSSRIKAEESTVRRLVHLCLPVLLLYYVFPQDTWIGIDKRLVLLGALFVFLVFEFVRLGYQVRIFGTRDYEMDNIAAYLWAGIGFTVAFLFFDFVIVVPAVLGMAWIDPLNGTLRTRNSGLYPWLPFACYLVLAAATLSIVSSFHPLSVVLIATVGAVSAIAAEHKRIRYVDDDFLMLVVPLVVMTAVSWTVSGA